MQVPNTSCPMQPLPSTGAGRNPIWPWLVDLHPWLSVRTASESVVWVNAQKKSDPHQWVNEPAWPKPVAKDRETVVLHNGLFFTCIFFYLWSYKYYAFISILSDRTCICTHPQLLAGNRAQLSNHIIIHHQKEHLASCQTDFSVHAHRMSLLAFTIERAVQTSWMWTWWWPLLVVGTKRQNTSTRWQTRSFANRLEQCRIGWWVVRWGRIVGKREKVENSEWWCEKEQPPQGIAIYTAYDLSWNN